MKPEVDKEYFTALMEANRGISKVFFLGNDIDLPGARSFGLASQVRALTCMGLLTPSFI